MAQRTNADLIRLLNKWQGSGFVHPLTCREEDCRTDLVPIERENAVVLSCPACGAIQLTLPPFVFSDDVEERLDAVAATLEEMRKEQAEDTEEP